MKIFQTKNFAKFSIQHSAFIILFFACSSDEEGTTPAVKELTEAVYASGNVYPRNEYKLYAQGDGVLVQQLVSEGDSVGNNQLLLSLIHI